MTISALFAVLACFEVGSIVVGLVMAGWICRRPGIQRLFEGVEEATMKAEQARYPITVPL